jgi:hypothetical protein
MTTWCAAPHCHYRFSLIFKTNLPTALSSVAETQELLATTRTICVVGKDSFVRHTNKKEPIMTTWWAAPRCHYRFSLIWRAVPYVPVSIHETEMTHHERKGGRRPQTTEKGLLMLRRHSQSFFYLGSDVAKFGKKRWRVRPISVV